MADIIGTEIWETLYGTPNEDFISGQGGDDTLLGNLGNDILVGDYGNDLLIGEGGADAMFGGFGNDSYRVENIGDSTTEIRNAGHDSVNSTIDWTLSAHVEDLTLYNPPANAGVGVGAVRGTGNGLANVIYGNNLNNVLNGLGGDDTMRGGIGNDRLNGGAGDDQLFGDVGNDVLAGGAGSDAMNGGFGNDRYLFTQADANLSATDTVRFGIGESDRIDLRQIDAIAGDGNQAFAFIGHTAFSGTAGELRYELVGTWMDWTDPFQPSGDRFEVSGDIDGDGIADFKIIVDVQSGNGGVTGPSAGIQASDFWL